MKKNAIITIMFLLITSVLALGCGPSLKEYVGQSQNYWSQTATTAYATVKIDNDTGLKSNSGVFGAIATTVNVANSVAGMAIEKEQGDRLHRLINPVDIATMVTAGFDENFVGKTHLQVVEQNQSPDLRVFLDVLDYGLYAKSAMDAMNFYVMGQIKLVYTPELKTIYERHATVSRTVSDVVADIINMTRMDMEVSGAVPPFMVQVYGLKTKLDALGDVVSIASGVANMSAFFQLTDADIVTIFQYMAYDAGHVIAEDLVNAIYQ